MPLKTLDIEKFEANAENMYEAVAICAKRARQINDEMKIELSQRLAPIDAKETEDDTIMNQDKLEISLDFEKRDKPTTQAVQELINGELTYRYRDEQ
jgi:DNA-directed RNA polymerase subunit K/omega